MTEPAKDMTPFTLRHLKYLARRGDEDARAELKRRMREATAEDERPEAEAEDNGSR
jgi:hypothetical protein